METAIRIENLTKVFNGTPALDHVSFQIPTGTLFGLLGPNGAGKTTLMRILVGILAPDEGRFTLPSHPTRRLKERIGYLPEERGLYLKMKVKDLLEYTTSIKGISIWESKKRVGDGLARFGIESYREKRVEELSKGNQQRVQLLTTLLHEPDILILDEPFTGLDPVGVNTMQSILFEEARRGATVMISTHRMEQAEQLCENLALIHKGRVIRDGNLAMLKKEEGGNELIVQSDDTLDTLDGLAGCSLVSMENHTLRVRVNPGYSVPAVIRELTNRISVYQIQEEKPSLHNIFVKLVQQEGKA
jgi:ABC-2 type transport system ATP-binding protein